MYDTSYFVCMGFACTVRGEDVMGWDGHGMGWGWGMGEDPGGR